MDNLSNILITGGYGRIGSEIDFGIKLSHSEMDVTNKESIKAAIEKYNPSGIINLASVDLRKCNEDPYLANKVNILGAYNLAVETKSRNIQLVILSSGAIFNGAADQNFSENDTPNPQNVYGQTKYLAEIVARSINPNTLIIRTGWIFGFTKKHNFFNKMLENAQRGEEISATIDHFGSFTYVKDLVGSIMNLITQNETGIYHVANSGRASALDMVNRLTDFFGSSSTINETSISESEKSGIMRSRSEVIISEKLWMRSWQEALDKFLLDIK